jgi:hypothetical protein
MAYKSISDNNGDFRNPEHVQMIQEMLIVVHTSLTTLKALKP